MAFGTRQLKHLTCHIRLDPRSGRPLRSGCGRGGLLGRNCPVAATGRWRCREGVVAAVADAVVVPCRPDPAVAAHPLVPIRPVGILLAVAHSEAAETPLPTRAEILRQVRLVRATPLPSPNLSTAEQLYVAGDVGAGVYGCVRLTGTPCEDAESCSTIWVGRTSGGTSNASLTLT
jgi:hypothetical protein